MNCAHLQKNEQKKISSSEILFPLPLNERLSNKFSKNDLQSEFNAVSIRRNEKLAQDDRIDRVAGVAS